MVAFASAGGIMEYLSAIVAGYGGLYGQALWEQGVRDSRELASCKALRGMGVTRLHASTIKAFAGASLTERGTSGSQVDYLQVPMRDILCRPGSTTPGTGSDVHGFNITEWELSDGERKDVADSVLQKLGGKTIGRFNLHSAPSQILYTSEAETNVEFFSHACNRITAIYEANGVKLAWRITPRSQVAENTLPDFVLMSLTSGQETMVGEGKYDSVLNDPMLVEACRGVRARSTGPGLRQSICCAVDQQCGYMDSRGMRYGYLTTHRKTFFIKFLSDKLYAITNAFPCTAINPSVSEMLFYLCEKSREEGRMQVQVDQAPTVVGQGPAAASGSGRESISHPGSSGGSAKRAKPSEQPGTGGRQHQSRAPASASCSISPHSMIPEDALFFGESLGNGLCGTVSHGRLFGQQVALKCVDACNSAHLIPHLQHEADGLSGPLQSLQGVCVPTLQACGYYRGGLMLVLATSVIHGRHPEPGQQSSLASAMQVLQAIHARGVAHGDIREENILIEGDGKLWFIDFGVSIINPTRDECKEDLLRLRQIFAGGSPDSDKLCTPNEFSELSEL